MGSFNHNLPRRTKVKKVKNKAPAAVQITAEQILREARECGEAEIRPPNQKINDSAELSDYQFRMRKGFEDQIRRQREDVNVWVRYANWEERFRDLERARSVWERIVTSHYRNPSVWVQYAEMEIKNKCINRARNVFDRAVELLPAEDKLWKRYIKMEKGLGNDSGAGEIYSRWMNCRQGQQCYFKVGDVIEYAKLEAKKGDVAKARNVFEKAVSELAEGDDEAEQLFVAFAELEEQSKGIERARCIYKYALDHIPKERAKDLCSKFLCFEKQYGDRQQIQDAVVRKTRLENEENVRKNPLDYNAWFDYIRLEESVGNKDRIREVYEQAVAKVPLALEKRYWQRYIYLWINYALYEELDACDVERARDVYKICLDLIPHKKFTFAKLWILAAEFQIRQHNLQGARKILGNAIGMAPRGKIFKKYIEMEQKLGNSDRCRTLYQKYVEWSPESCYPWIAYAEFEKSLLEIERARAVFEFAISQKLHQPDILWNAYIDFELTQDELERARQLYHRLLDRTKHVMIWIRYATFEASAIMAEEDHHGPDNLGEQAEQCLQNARRVFERALDYFRTSAPELKEERRMLLDAWLQMEKSFGDLGDVALVKSKLPRKLKKRRARVTPDGPAGFEEYIDYLFPGDEETQTMNLKILEAAYRWKKQKVEED